MLEVEPPELVTLESIPPSLPPELVTPSEVTTEPSLLPIEPPVLATAESTPPVDVSGAPTSSFAPPPPPS
jgi:hypothetical protein